VGRSYQTPNIDRIAKEGVAFTDYYAQQSCTAGRAAFIGGNVPVRTGIFVIVPISELAGKFLMTMKEYPPSQTAGSFNLTKIQKQIEAMAGSGSD